MASATPGPPDMCRMAQPMGEANAAIVQQANQAVVQPGLASFRHSPCASMSPAMLRPCASMPPAMLSMGGMMAAPSVPGPSQQNTQVLPQMLQPTLLPTSAMPTVTLQTNAVQTGVMQNCANFAHGYQGMPCMPTATSVIPLQPMAPQTMALQAAPLPGRAQASYGQVTS